MLQPKLSLLAILISASLLSACGDSTTNIVEKDPIAGDDDHDHGDSSAVGRLVISAKDSNLVSVYELEDGSLLDSFAVADTPSALAASANKRYALVVQRGSDRIEFIDGGVFQEDHGDHLHAYKQAPELSSFVISGSRPTHISQGKGQLAVFLDGDAASGTPAAALVLTDLDISSDNNAYPVLQYDTNLHGVAQARGDYMLATLRDADAPGTLPNKVGLFHAHGDHFHDETVFSPDCPGLHGSAQNESVIGFGCTDGVLLITQDDAGFSATKLANTADFTGTMRIGALAASMDAEHLMGLAGNKLFAIDAEHAQMTQVDWQPAEGAAVVGAGFADDAHKFVVLDNQGYLTILDYHGHEHGGDEAAFALATKVQLTTADVSTMPTGSRFELAIPAAGDKVYVTNPIDSSLLTIDLEDAAIVATKQLNFVPQKLVWLGITAEDDGHQH